MDLQSRLGLRGPLGAVSSWTAWSDRTASIQEKEAFRWRDLACRHSCGEWASSRLDRLTCLP